MGSATSSEGQVSRDEGVVTVNAATENSPGVDDDILDRLGRLPQVKQVNSSTGPEDQLWRELTSYSQAHTQQQDGYRFLFMQTWCKSQASVVAQQQDFVNSRIEEVDNLASEVLQECARRQHTLQTATQSLKSLAATQQHMEELCNRLALCSSAVAAAHTEVDASRGAGEG